MSSSYVVVFFFFKQKTAYEMRISDWSSDVCSSDLLKRVVEKRFLAYTRFRQKAVDTASGATWQEDAHFDLDWHVQLAALPGQGDGRRTPRDGAQKRALERFASQLASSPLDKHRPLWQFHLVERY